MEEGVKVGLTLATLVENMNKIFKAKNEERRECADVYLFALLNDRRIFFMTVVQVLSTCKSLLFILCFRDFFLTI